MMEREVVRNLEEAQAFGRDNLDAVSSSTAAMARGLQNVAAQVADYSRQSFEQSADALQKVLGAKSFTTVFEIQQEYARKAFDAYLGGLTKVNEICLAAAKEAMQPYEARIQATSAKMGEAANRAAENTTKVAQAATRGMRHS
jgi:phasin family protein